MLSTIGICIVMNSRNALLIELYTLSVLLENLALHEATRNRGASQSKFIFGNERPEYRVGLPRLSKIQGMFDPLCS